MIMEGMILHRVLDNSDGLNYTRQVTICERRSFFEPFMSCIIQNNHITFLETEQVVHSCSFRAIHMNQCTGHKFPTLMQVNGLQNII